jgi:hypothetical protein
VVERFRTECYFFLSFSLKIKIVTLIDHVLLQHAISSYLINDNLDGIALALHPGSCGVEGCILEVFDPHARSAFIPHRSICNIIKRYLYHDHAVYRVNSSLKNTSWIS